MCTHENTDTVVGNMQGFAKTPKLIVISKEQGTKHLWWETASQF